MTLPSPSSVLTLIALTFAAICSGCGEADHDSASLREQRSAALNGHERDAGTIAAEIAATEHPSIDYGVIKAAQADGRLASVNASGREHEVVSRLLERKQYPRPRKAGWFKQQGSARTPEQILADLDRPRIHGTAPATDAPRAVIDAWLAEERTYRLKQINLVSELEASGLSGEELEPRVRVKLRDCAYLRHRMPQHQAALKDVLHEAATMYSGTTNGALAQLLRFEHVLFSNQGLLRLADQTLEEIADLERLAAALNEPERHVHTGRVLWEAVRWDDEPTRARWKAWMIEHLPGDAMLVRKFKAEAIFGHPIRLTGTDFDGTVIDTHDWVGEVILVKFWGSWCHPCTARMPTIAAWRERFESRGFRVLGVAWDTHERGSAFLGKHPQFDWPHIAPQRGTEAAGLGSNPVIELYGVDTFPTYWIIDRSARVHAQNRADGYKELESSIARFLDEPGP